MTDPAPHHPASRRVRTPLPSNVATFLTPFERQRVDAAGQGCYHARHCESLDELLTDLRTRTVSAVLVSVARYQTQHAPQVARLVREFPRVPAVALLTGSHPNATQAVLALGQNGVRSLIDAREPTGWRDLRLIVSGEAGGRFEYDAYTIVRDEIIGAPPDCHRFFEQLFCSPPSVSTVQQIARLNNVVPSTFMSRFFRVRLPAPKRYLAFARLVRAARLFENPGLSVTHVANHLEFSSPQSFSRHVHLLLDITPMALRRQYDGAKMLEQFRQQLVLPYRSTLLHFEPFSATPLYGAGRESSSSTAPSSRAPGSVGSRATVPRSTLE